MTSVRGVWFELKRHDALGRIAGILMFGVFSTNLYIALYDGNLPDYNMPHYYLNWAIVVVEVIAGIILLIKTRNARLVLFAGIVWPIVYLLSLAIDIETDLCLGTNMSCWPSPSDAFQYLIFGSKAEGWGLWPYTIPVAIALLGLIMVLSGLSIRLMRKDRLSEKVTQPGQTTQG